MFNLENEIKKWRKLLQNHPGMEPGYVEELESHLRDKIDDFVSQGMMKEEAFKVAMKAHADSAAAIAEEYHIARRTSYKQPKWKSHTTIMNLLPNFLKITLRNFRKKKAFSFINIFGLAVGLAACLLMVLFVTFELSFDQFHHKKDRIYQVTTKIASINSDGFGHNSTNGWPIGMILESEYPEIQEAIYIRRFPQYSIKHDEQYYFDNTLIADKDFFNVFDFKLLKGNPETALEKPNTLIITEELEKKYFGSQSGMGETLTLQDSLNFTVTGVLESIPENSHIQFDALISLSSWSKNHPDFNTSGHWLDLNMSNYVLLNEGVNTASLKQKISTIYMDRAGDYFKNYGYRAMVSLVPLGDIYLHPNYGNFLGPQGDADQLWLLGAIALFILIIACINFINLSTARSLERAKEVGIRKVVGSGKQSLIGQFLTESTLVTILSLIFALFLASLALPYFNELTGNNFDFAQLMSQEMGLTLLIFIIVVGLLSGLYPAFVLSDFRPVHVLKDNYMQGGRGVMLRKVLVVFQFAISCFLIISTIVVVKQLRYMQNQNLGFQKDQIIVMDSRRAINSIKADRYELVKNELLTNPAINKVSATLAVPGRSGYRSILMYGEGQPKDQARTVEYLSVDFDYLSTFDLEIIAGRGFSRDFSSDATEGVVINEAAVERFGWETPEEAIGKYVITVNSMLNDPVIGVVKNYHHHGLQEQIQPIVMTINPPRFSYFALEFDPTETDDVLGHMESVWNQFFSGYTFDYFFLDQDFVRQYEQQKRMAKIYGSFSTFAIIIAGLGLFGLVAFSTTQRVKEIGIRKVLGASVTSIVTLLSREFLVLVVIALMVASPLAYLFMTDWLQDFAFRTSIGIGIFVLTAIIAIVITVLTISWQSIKAATRNPVESLRSE